MTKDVRKSNNKRRASALLASSHAAVLLDAIQDDLLVPLETAVQVTAHWWEQQQQQQQIAIPRENVLAVLGAQQQQAAMIEAALYVAQEDGSLVGYNDHQTIGWYREPGMAYEWSSSTNQRDLYGNLCRSAMTGQAMECRLQAGDTFISSTTADAETDSFVPCQPAMAAQSPLCLSSYQVSTLSSSSPYSMGYIPRSYHCLDLRAQFSNQQARYWSESKHSIQYHETCAYGNGLSVQESTAGNYSHCGTTSCSDTFAGMFQTQRYDARLRNWYQHAKQRVSSSTLLLSWSPWYTFFSQDALGMTVTMPLVQPVIVPTGGGDVATATNFEDRSLLVGFVAADLSVSSIQSLLETYTNSSTAGAVLHESEPPHFVVASSLPDFAPYTLARNQCLYTLVEPCPALLRTTVDELFQQDFALKAPLEVAWHRISSNNDHQSSSAWLFSNQDEAYLAGYTANYTHSDTFSTSWNLLTVQVAPPDLIIVGDASSSSTNPSYTSVEPGHPYFAIILVITIMSLSLSATCLGWYWWTKQRQASSSAFVTKRTDQTFIWLSLGSAMIWMASIPIVLGPNTDATCLARPWVLIVGAAMSLSPLIVKTIRIYKWITITASQSFRLVQCPLWKVVALSAALLPTLHLIVLLVLTVTDPIQAQIWEGGSDNNDDAIIVASDSDQADQEYVCEANTPAWEAVQFGLWGITLVGACSLGYINFKIDSSYGQIGRLNLAFWHWLVTYLLMTILWFAIPNMTQAGQALWTAVAIGWTGTGMHAIFCLDVSCSLGSTKTRSIRQTRSGRNQNAVLRSTTTTATARGSSTGAFCNNNQHGNNSNIIPRYSSSTELKTSRFSSAELTARTSNVALPVRASATTTGPTPTTSHHARPSALVAAKQDSANLAAAAAEASRDFYHTWALQENDEDDDDEHENENGSIPLSELSNEGPSAELTTRQQQPQHNVAVMMREAMSDSSLSAQSASLESMGDSTVEALMVEHQIAQEEANWYFRNAFKPG